MNEEIEKDILKIKELKEDMLELNQQYEAQLKQINSNSQKNKSLSRQKYTEIPLKYFWDLLNMFRLK